MRETYMKVDKLHSKIFKDCFYREKTFQEHLLEDKLTIRGYIILHITNSLLKKVLLLRIQNKLCLTINREIEILTQIESEHKQ